MEVNPQGVAYLVIGAILSFIASALHIGIIIGGASWYRFFSAGEDMAMAAEAGKLFPHIMTLGIAIVLAVWGAYALSGAAVIPRLPLLKVALVGITVVYLLRGLLFYPLFADSGNYSNSFLIWSSLICLGFGLVHLMGVYLVWSEL